MMFFTAVILLGFISWSRLPQELFPSIAYPQLTVVTSYENAAPEEIESLITKLVEEAAGTVNNVKRISSISKEGISLVMIEFNWGTNMDFAALNVREKIDLIKERLPRESQEPVVMKYNPFDLPVMNLAITGLFTPLELREMCNKHIKDSIEKVEGVASASISGGEEREILVEIDQPRLRASQISIVSVVDGLKATNLNYPAGTIKESFYEYLIRTMGEFQKVEEIKDVPAALDLPEDRAKTVKEQEEKEKQGKRLVFLKDIAKIKDTVKEKTSISRYNGKDSVSLVIRKQSGTNSLRVVRGVRKEIQKLLSEKLPKGIVIQVTYDQSQFIQEALSNVLNAAVLGAILAFFILLLILRNIRSALVITTSIPISIMATICLMYFTNINLNVMSLGGLALGVGMLVDNAVVVIENIFRHRNMKKDPQTACIEGAEEMLSPVLGSTLTTVAVFLPFAFVVGVVGQIFKQLSLTITFSLIASVITAVCLVPVLMSIGKQRISYQKPDESPWRKRLKELLRVDKINSFFGGSYEDFIRSMLDKRLVVLVVIGALFTVSLFLLFTTERQFLPKVDQRQFVVKVDLAPGSRLELTDSVVKKMERLLLKLPETKDITVNIGSSEQKASLEETSLQALGSHQAQVMVNLKKKSRRQNIRLSTDEVINYLKTNLEKENLEGAEIEYVAQESSFGSALEQGAPITVEIKGPDLARLVEISDTIQNDLRKVEGVYGVKSNMPLPSPETKLHILQDKASLYGLSVRDIAITAQVALKGYVATKFKEKEGQEDVDIRVRLRPEDRSDLGNLRRLLVHSPLGFDVSLSEMATLTRGRGPTEIKRIDQQRSILVTANVYKRNFNDVVIDINHILRSQRYRVSKDYTIELTGEQQRMQESFQSMAFALALAIILVYMIMAGEFESLWQPFMIMFTIPLSLIGVSFALFATRTPLSSVAYLGIIMLGGIAVNNAIVLIEFVNQLVRQEGYSIYEALVHASKTRLRPIMLTSLTTIFGLLPLALGIGEGSELQAPLAITVMGGLVSSTFLTLVFIPCLYLFVSQFIKESGPLTEKTEDVLEAPSELEKPAWKDALSTLREKPQTKPADEEKPAPHEEAPERMEQVFHQPTEEPKLPEPEAKSEEDAYEIGATDAAEEWKKQISRMHPPGGEKERYIEKPEETKREKSVPIPEQQPLPEEEIPQEIEIIKPRIIQEKAKPKEEEQPPATEKEPQQEEIPPQPAEPVTKEEMQPEAAEAPKEELPQEQLPVKQPEEPQAPEEEIKPETPPPEQLPTEPTSPQEPLPPAETKETPQEPHKEQPEQEKQLQEQVPETLVPPEEKPQPQAVEEEKPVIKELPEEVQKEPLAPEPREEAEPPAPPAPAQEEKKAEIKKPEPKKKTPQKPKVPAEEPQAPPEETEKKKKPVASEGPSEGALNPRQTELLEKLKTMGKITRKDYAQMFGISVPTAARDLKELVDKKLLTPKGPLGPGRWYELS